MKLAIPLTPPSLDDALAFVDQLRTHPEADSTLMTEEQWEQAVTAAAGKRDRDDLGTLLRVQLVPALSRALVSLAQAVRLAVDVARSTDEGSYERSVRLAQLLETAQLDLMRAGQATWAGELRSGLLPDHAGPAQVRADSFEGVKERAAAYMQMQIDGDDVLETVADDLGLALRKLTGNARGAIEEVDQGRLDELLAQPLQLQLFAAFHVLSSARIYFVATNMTVAAANRMHAESPG